LKTQFTFPLGCLLFLTVSDYSLCRTNACRKRNEKNIEKIKRRVWIEKEEKDNDGTQMDLIFRLSHLGSIRTFSNKP